MRKEGLKENNNNCIQKLLLLITNLIVYKLLDIVIKYTFEYLGEEITVKLFSTSTWLTYSSKTKHNSPVLISKKNHLLEKRCIFLKKFCKWYTFH